MQSLDLESILAFATDTAREAGELIRSGQAARFQNRSQSMEKSNTVDLVTEIDRAVEDFIKSRIQKEYPDHTFIGEESFSGAGIPEGPTWIVDPIDGTTNFVHGFPMVATSIGLTSGGVPVIGVVYNPFLDLMYTAAKGKGAYLNNQALPISGTPLPLERLSEALIGFEFGLARDPGSLEPKVSAYQRLLVDNSRGGKMVRGMRDMGSAAMNVCLVASGALDIHWETGCWAWDVCAGICILTEAGGAAFGSKNGPLDGKVDSALLGRKYLFIRALAADNGSSLASQQLLAKEFYDVLVGDDF